MKKEKSIAELALARRLLHENRPLRGASERASERCEIRREEKEMDFFLQSSCGVALHVGGIHGGILRYIISYCIIANVYQYYLWERDTFLPLLYISLFPSRCVTFPQNLRSNKERAGERKKWGRLTPFTTDLHKTQGTPSLLWWSGSLSKRVGPFPNIWSPSSGEPETVLLLNCQINKLVLHEW